MRETRGLGIPVGEGLKGASGNGDKAESKNEGGLPGAYQTPSTALGAPWKAFCIFGITVSRQGTQCPLPLSDSAQPSSVTYFIFIKVPGAYTLGRAGSVAWNWMHGVHLGSHQQKQPSLWNTPSLATAPRSRQSSLCSRAAPSSYTPCRTPTSWLVLDTNRGILLNYQPNTHRTYTRKGELSRR